MLPEAKVLQIVLVVNKKLIGPVEYEFSRWREVLDVTVFLAN